MRQEYGRLAEAAHHPRDIGHEALIEEHIEVTLSVLHHHHAEEDNWLWPTMRQRAPAARPTLERLEAQHAQIDPLIATAADTSRPWRLRATALAELHAAINTHLDEETADPAAEYRAHQRRGMGRLRPAGTRVDPPPIHANRAGLGV